VHPRLAAAAVFVVELERNLLQELEVPGISPVEEFQLTVYLEKLFLTHLMPAGTQLEILLEPFVGW